MAAVVFRVPAFSLCTLLVTEETFINRLCLFHLWMKKGFVRSPIFAFSHLRSTWPSKQLPDSPLARNLVIERTTLSTIASSWDTKSSSQERVLGEQSPSWWAERWSLMMLLEIVMLLDKLDHRPILIYYLKTAFSFFSGSWQLAI